MNNNTNLNNAAINSISNSKEESVMGMRKEELVGKNVKELRTIAKDMGISGYSKLKKFQLINTIMFFEAKRKEEQGNDINHADNKEESKMNEKKEVGTTVEARKDILNALVKDIAFRVLSDTLLTDKDGSIIIRKDKNGKVVLKNGALFFRPTKVEVESGTYMVVTKRLWAVLKDECTKFCAKHDDLKDVTEDIAKQTIESAIELMIKNDILTAVKVERNYIKLDPKTMSQEEKDTLNALWKDGKITTKKLSGKDDGKIMTTAVGEDGKNVLNELYPCYSYRATAAQMNNMFAIIKSR